MLKRLKEKLLLSTDSILPTSPDVEIIGVFNPGVERMGDEVIMLARVVQASLKKDDARYCCLRSRPGRDGSPCLEEFWCRRAGSPDQFGVIDKHGYSHLKFISHLEIVRLSGDGYTVKSITRLSELFGVEEYEEWGVEDPRITRIGEKYLITYVGISREMSIVTCLMETTDFKTFHRHGIIFPPSNKDVVIYPERIGEDYLVLHRPTLIMKTRNYAILGARSKDLVHWGRHEFVMEASADQALFDSHRIGAGVPPIKTGVGWLHIYHGVRNEDPVCCPSGVYRAGAFITALDQPFRVIARCPHSIMEVEKDYEKSGYVDRVVFPTGAIQDRNNSDHLHVYYGCADQSIAVVTLSLSEIIKSCQPVS